VRWAPLAALGTLTAVAGALAPLGTPAIAAGSHALIVGTGSSWAYNAVNQWVSDVAQQGLQVVFTSTGSATGRADFANKTNDFAVSDIGYQGRDPLTGSIDSNNGRGFAYLPIVAGGTAFPYQIKVGGQLVRNLRLSGKTLTRIFTNQITSWDDPAITADNNGTALPGIPIIPVIHSEGSGSTAQFTTFMNTVYPGIWQPFAGGAGFTEYFPQKGSSVAENGSDGVMNFVSAGGSNGAIGYDEYSYALGKGFPVVKIENTANYFTLPDQYNVAVALTKAKIDTTDAGDPTKYLTQDLSQVYVNPDPRTYPLSSYSYAIIPTDATDPKMTTAKRQTIVDYLFYSVCDGQKEIGPIGYSPLPVNLVQASIDQIDKLGPGPPGTPGADPNVSLSGRDVASCNNPTFIPGDPTGNHLAEIAPLPPTCDQAGQGPCTDGRTVVIPGKTAAGGSGPGQSGGPGSAGRTAAASSSASAAASAKTSSGKSAGAKGSAGTSGPGTGQAGAGADQTSTGPGASAAASKTFVADGPPLLHGHAVGMSRLLGLLALVLVLVALVAPAVLIVILSHARKEDE
jgi:phosphate ABC transporter phosphate-binding protein